MSVPLPAAGDEVALLTALVGAEHAAVYAYGVLGARLDADLRERAQAADDAHRVRRDALAGLLRDRGAPVPAALPAYDVAVATPEAALALAVRLEEGLGTRWLALVAGAEDGTLRALGVSGLQETAVRAASWRRRLGLRPPTVALPGAGS